jgi:hypothetical protein
MILQDFADKYSCSSTFAYPLIKRGVVPKSVIFGEHGHRFIDEAFFVGRMNFGNKVIDKCHEHYYFLIEKYSEADIAELLHIEYPEHSKSSWNSFIYKSLFNTLKTVTKFYIQPMLWKFYRGTIKLSRLEREKSF